MLIRKDPRLSQNDMLIFLDKICAKFISYTQVYTVKNELKVSNIDESDQNEESTGDVESSGEESSWTICIKIRIKI
jgi:hypothetical protein